MKVNWLDGKEIRQQQLSKKQRKKMKSSDAGGFVTEAEQKSIDNEIWAWGKIISKI